MQLSSLPTEIRTVCDKLVGRVYLDWMPQPGNYLELDGETYTVLERRHRYQLRRGRYSLYKIVVYVQRAQPPSERTLLDGRWVIGDTMCRFNAMSEVIRCAVNPLGPCESCSFREARG